MLGPTGAAATLSAFLSQKRRRHSVSHNERENVRGDRSRVFFLDPWQAGLHPPWLLRKGQDSSSPSELPALLVTFTISLRPQCP